MQSICAFIGASLGNNPRYAEYTIALGKEIAKRGFSLVYGGANVGLMGLLADTVIDSGGKVIGVIPQSTVLPGEIAHRKLTELHIVESMQARKLMMAKSADAFIALPGGLGTLEEMFEVWNAIKLGLYQKPFGLLNIDGYFDHLIEFMNVSVNRGFMQSDHLKLISVSNNPSDLLLQLSESNCQPAFFDKQKSEGLFSKPCKL